MSRATIEAEIARLRAAKSTTVAAFAAKRAARLVELEAALATLPADAPAPDAALEGALRRVGGGDRFDRRGQTDGDRKRS